MIQEDTIQQVKNATNIVEVVGWYVKLKKSGADHEAPCPFHNEKTPSFKVNKDKQIFKCFGCGKSGDAIAFVMEHEKKSYIETIRFLAEKYNISVDEEKKEYVKPQARIEKLSPTFLENFEQKRKISNNTLLRFGITEAKEWMPQTKAEMAVLCFNYYRDGELINIKFRGANKAFKMAKDAELIFYNLDAIKGVDDCVIVEGEIDALSCHEAGILNVVSVPNGAGAGNLKLEYLDNCFHYFAGMKKIVLATDADTPGKTLRAELARRLGLEKCYTVEYPAGCKDLNDVLVKQGADAVQRVINGAKEWPLEGIKTGFQLYDDVLEYYDNGYPSGYAVPVPGLRNALRLELMLGQMTVATGIPGSGKSEFIDWVMVEMSRVHGWRWGVMSAENQPPGIHATKLMEKYEGKAFGFRRDLSKRIDRDRINKIMDFIDEHFFFVNINEVDMSITGLLEKARELVARKGIRGFLIDPWNRVAHARKGYASETEYINWALTAIQLFAQKYQVHVVVVAHPTKMQKDKGTKKYDVPTLYNISGSSNWYNQADVGLVVYRDFEKNVVDVYIQKVRYHWLGETGMCSYTYDKETRKYNYLDSQGIQPIEFSQPPIFPGDETPF